MVVLGVGNTLVSDDGVGIQVVRELGRRIKDHRVVFTESQSGGLDVLEQLMGYRDAIVVDAARTGSVSPGRLSVAELDCSSCPGCQLSLHTLGLRTAISFGKMLGYALPTNVTVFGVEVADVETFHEGCTAGVEAAIPSVTSEIARFLQMKLTDLCCQQIFPHK